MVSKGCILYIMRDCVSSGIDITTADLLKDLQYNITMVIKTQDSTKDKQLKIKIIHL